MIDDFDINEAGEKVDLRALKSVLGVEDFDYVTLKINDTTYNRLDFADHGVRVAFNGLDPATLNASHFLFNLAPVATDDAFTLGDDEDPLTTIEDTVLIISADVLIGDDADPDGDELALVSVGDATNGTVELVDGTVRFTPDADFHGTASFTYTVSDSLYGPGAEDQATVTINVLPQNDAPNLVAAPMDQGATQDVGFTYTLPADLFDDADGEAVTLSASLATGSPLPVWLAFDGSTFSGTPTATDVGAILVRITGSDPNGAETSTEFTLTVANVNDAPTVADGLEDHPVQAGKS